MKIGFDAKRLFHNQTGLGNYSRDLVRILKEFYPDDTYVLFNPKDKKIPFYSDASLFKTVTPRGWWKKLHSIWRTYGIAKENSIQELDIYHGLSGEIPANLPATIKKVVSIHDLIFERYPNLYSNWDRRMHRKKFQYAVDHADAIVAISEQTKRDIVQFLQVPETKIHVIYQGCSAIFKQSFSDEALHNTRTKFGLPQTFVLNVGTLEERKNAFSLVKAIKDLDTTLVLIGRETDYCKAIHQYIEKHQLHEKVLFLKNVSQLELAHIYTLATVFAYPSVFEGFGIPIIEAMFCNTPVITTNSGVFPEAGGPDSIYVDPYDIQDISTQINRLLNDAALRNTIATKGRDYVERFQDTTIAVQWHNLYKNIL